MTIALIVSIVCLSIVSSLCVLIAVIFSRTTEKAFSYANVVDQRSREHLDRLLNRLMTIRWEDFLLVNSAEGSEEGGFLSPEDQEEIEFNKAELTEEQVLLAEDFPR